MSRRYTRWAKWTDVDRYKRELEAEYQVDITVSYSAPRKVKDGEKVRCTVVATTREASELPQGYYTVSGEVIEKEDKSAVDDQHMLLYAQLFADMQIARTYGVTFSTSFSPLTP